jgi:hypothetical protein
MKHKVIFLMLLFLSVLSKAQYYKISFSDIKVTGAENATPANGSLFVRLKDGAQESINIYESSILKIEAKAVLSQYSSRRSSMKSTGTKIAITYHAYYAGIKDKRDSEYIVFIENTGTTKVKELFTFVEKGVKKSVMLYYTLTIADD